MKAHRIAPALILLLAVGGLAQAEVLTVTNTADDGSPGCLRWCIEHAQPDDEIKFDPSLDGQPILLERGLLIDKDLVIAGRGPEATILDGGRFTRFPPPLVTPLRVLSGVRAHISAVTVRNGASRGSGGGIQNEGNLSLDDCVVRDNQAGWGMHYRGSGGGILNDGTLTVSNSRIIGNQADAGGGGIDNSGTAHVTISDISDNYGSPASGSGWPRGGGGIRNSGTAVMTRSTISGNYGEGIFIHGGEVIVNGSTIRDNDGNGVANGYRNCLYGGTLSITDSTISDNEAAYGGGIYNAESLTLTRSTISGNTTGFGSWKHAGGGIFSCGTLTMDSSTISGNRTYGYGGGVVVRSRGTVRHSTISGNYALEGGGVVLSPPYYCSSCTLRLVNSVVANQLRGPDCVILNPRRAPLVSLGNNLDSDGSCGLDHPTDQSNTDAKLGPLQDSYGPTLTHVPLKGSPVIDRGWCDTATDQRGVPRPIDGNLDNVWLCDIGAVEYVPFCDRPHRPCDGKEYELIGPLGQPIVIFF